MASVAKNSLAQMSEEKFDKCEKEIENYFENKKLHYYIDGMGLANGEITFTIWKNKNESINLEINEPLNRESTEEECLKWIHGIIEKIDEKNERKRKNTRTKLENMFKIFVEVSKILGVRKIDLLEMFG